MFEGIYDDPIEAEMEIKESSFSQINATEYTNWVYIDLSERKAMTVEIGEEHKSEIIPLQAESDIAAPSIMIFLKIALLLLLISSFNYLGLYRPI